MFCQLYDHRPAFVFVLVHFEKVGKYNDEMGFVFKLIVYHTELI